MFVGDMWKWNIHILLQPGANKKSTRSGVRVCVCVSAWSWCTCAVPQRMFYVCMNEHCLTGVNPWEEHLPACMCFAWVHFYVCADAGLYTRIHWDIPVCLPWLYIRNTCACLFAQGPWCAGSNIAKPSDNSSSGRCRPWFFCNEPLKNASGTNLQLRSSKRKSSVKLQHQISSDASPMIFLCSIYCFWFSFYNLPLEAGGVNEYSSTSAQNI